MNNLKRKIKFLFFTFLYVLFSNNLFSADIKPIQSRNYENLTSFIHELNSDFTVTNIGNIQCEDSFGKYDYPVYKISYIKSESYQKIDSRKYLFLYGLHGNEPAPVFGIKNIIQEINEEKIKIPNNTQVDFIFIMNPFGFERNYRYCSNHTDPNRDLNTQTTKEMQILTQATKEKYDLVIDFHEATCDGTFFYAYNQKGKKYAKNILNYLKKQNVLLENEYVDVILKVKNGLLYSAFYAQWYMKLKGSVTTGMYFKDRGIPLVFTVETPKRGNFEERCRIIKLIFEKVIS
ncbi:MAG: succinylglutamate desuccinylase/aspartoacylase family protein [Spirochaetaceae bacterium]|nr:succinylglutamate desuccinylase/aspartoacylase family protein [Spirochaetaceae bacterium]